MSKEIERARIWTCAGLLLLLAFYMLVVRLFTSHDVMSFLRNTRELLLLAFSTSSSAAVMPLSIKTAEEKLNIHASVSQFVIPLGATINMNGTALYQGVATIFLAQIFGVDLSLTDLATVEAAGPLVEFGGARDQPFPEVGILPGEIPQQVVDIDEVTQFVRHLVGELLRTAPARRIPAALPGCSCEYRHQAPGARAEAGG